ncbi:MAG: C-GCAxxG-C-C family protein [Gudongella sp.]|nr:C-GCAxxG-C-C family protein [Gudongella sp.]
MINIKNISKEERDSILKEAYDLAFKYEKEYGCCSQCVIAPISKIFDLDLGETFKSSYGLGAGIGLSSEGACGALNAGVMIISSLIGRSYDDFDKGRNDICYKKSKELLVDFKEEFGSTMCGGVQTILMGSSFDLSIQEELGAFNEAGGHSHKCPNVVGFVSQRIAKMILDGDLS